MSNCDRFRKTFENLSSSFTEEDLPIHDKSDHSKSDYTFEKSFNDNSYAGYFHPCHKSTDWVDDHDSTTPQDLHFNQAYLSRLTQIQESLYIEIESLKNDKKFLSSENIQLRSKIQDLEKQFDVQHEKLQKKEKEINNLIFEKEFLVKCGEETKRLVEDMKQSLETTRSEKRELVKVLKEYEMKNKSFRKSIKVKKETILNLEQVLELKNRGTEFLSPNFKSCTNRLRVSKFDFSEKRVGSDSPERKSLQCEREEPYKMLYLEIRRMLDAGSSMEVREKIVKLKEGYLKFKKTQKFISKLSNMIVQISPLGSFSSEPSTRQMWKWLTRLLEEYMKLKQTMFGESFNKLCALLNVVSVEEMVEKVIGLQRSRAVRNS